MLTYCLLFMTNGTYTLLTELAIIKQLIDNVQEYNWSVKMLCFLLQSHMINIYVYKYMNIDIKSLTNSLIDKQYPIHFGNRSLRESVVDVW